jgi:hypothetical protein
MTWAMCYYLWKSRTGFVKCVLRLPACGSDFDCVVVYRTNSLINLMIKASLASGQLHSLPFFGVVNGKGVMARDDRSVSLFCVFHCLGCIPIVGALSP